MLKLPCAPIFVPLFLAGTLLAGCAAEQKAPRTAAETESEAAKAYNEAMVEFFDKNWDYAAIVLAEVRSEYPGTPYAKRAQLRLADVAFRQNRFPEAVAEYRSYIHNHPNDSQIPYARFRVLRSQFLTTGDSLLLPPLEERDLSPVREAYSGLRAFRAAHPNYPEVEELDFMYRSVAGTLARHELYVARFYLGRDELHAAKRRVQYMIRTYGDTGLEPEAIVLLGEIFLKMQEQRQAVALFRHVLKQYPNSSFGAPAREHLRRLETTSRMPASATN